MSTFVNHLAALGRPVTLVLTNSSAADCQFPLNEAVSLISLRDGLPSSIGRLRSFWRRSTALRRLIIEAKPSAIYSMLTHVNILVLIATRGLGIPTIVSERTYPPMHPIGRSLMLLRRITYPWATRVVMQTRQGLQWLVDEIRGARGIVIGNPLALPLPLSGTVICCEDYLSPSDKLFLAVGRLVPSKQFDLLIESFRALSAECPSWKLAILGHGEESGKLRRLVSADPALSNAVILPGETGNLADWYRRCDIFVMTSRYEGFPNTLMEALGHGCASISFDCLTGPGDLISHEVNGLLVPPQHGARGIKDAMKRLVDNPSLRASLSAEARSVTQDYAVDKIASRWLDAGVHS